MPGFTEADIASSVVDVWRGFTTLDVTPAGPAAAPVPLPEPLVSACITIRSRWYGAVVILCPQALLDRAARNALQVPEPSQGDRNAVLGECVNMIAHCLKPFFETGAQLSLPVVATGSYPFLFLPDGKRTLNQRFLADDGTPFEVSVVIMGDAG